MCEICTDQLKLVPVTVPVSWQPKEELERNGRGPGYHKVYYVVAKYRGDVVLSRKCDSREDQQEKLKHLRDYMPEILVPRSIVEEKVRHVA